MKFEPYRTDEELEAARRHVQLQSSVWPHRLIATVDLYKSAFEKAVQMWAENVSCLQCEVQACPGNESCAAAIRKHWLALAEAGLQEAEGGEQ